MGSTMVINDDILSELVQQGWLHGILLGIQWFTTNQLQFPFLQYSPQENMKPWIKHLQFHQISELAPESSSHLSIFIKIHQYLSISIFIWTFLETELTHSWVLKKNLVGGQSPFEPCKYACGLVILGLFTTQFIEDNSKLFQIHLLSLDNIDIHLLYMLSFTQN